VYNDFNGSFLNIIKRSNFLPESVTARQAVALDSLVVVFAPAIGLQPFETTFLSLIIVYLVDGALPK
jgi:hypothetical protein